MSLSGERGGPPVTRFVQQSQAGVQLSLRIPEMRPAQGYRVWKSMAEIREHIENKKRVSSCSIPEFHVKKLQRDHPDPNAIPLRPAKGFDQKTIVAACLAMRELANWYLGQASQRR